MLLIYQRVILRVYSLILEVEFPLTHFVKLFKTWESIYALMINENKMISRMYFNFRNKKCSYTFVMYKNGKEVYLSPMRASLIAQLVKNLPAMQEIPVRFLVGKIRWRRDRLPTPVFFGFPCGSAGKESACTAGNLGSIPGLGRSPGEGKGYPIWYSGLENSVGCIVLGVPKSGTQLILFLIITRNYFLVVGLCLFYSLELAKSYIFKNSTFNFMIRQIIKLI